MLEACKLNLAVWYVQQGFLMGLLVAILDISINLRYNILTERRYMTKIHVNYRITEEEKKLIEALAKQLGVSETDVIKLSIRKLAKEEGVKIQ